MKNNHHSPRRLTALLLVVAVMLSLVPSAFAAQQNSYHDPAEHWQEALNRTNELDANSVVTVETFDCCICDKATAFEVFRVPEYPSFHLSNNNANIRRVQQRIDDLKNRGDFVGWEFPGGTAEINEGENRLQLFFDEKPTEKQRQELKHNGFKWAPSQGAWQRQLNRNAIFAAGRMDFLRTADGQSPVQLQPFARREREEPSR